jgi:flavodoxin
MKIQCDMSKKTLIAFYSRAGQNYVDGNIVNLEIGNTEVVANKIKKCLADADLFKIETVKDYPDDYTDTTEVAKVELHRGTRPALKGEVADMAKYDTVILGYPNWWGTMPMAVFTFLESYDLIGKTIIPFCTHEGGGMGHSVNDVKRLCHGSTVLSGTPIPGAKVHQADRQAQLIADKVR